MKDNNNSQNHKRNLYEKFYPVYITNRSADYAEKYGLKINPNSGLRRNYGYDDEADAFRHAFLSADLALKFNKDISHIITSEHELPYHKDIDVSDYKWSQQKNMDMWNNRVGEDVSDIVIKKYGKKGFEGLPKQVQEDIIAEEIIKKMKNKEMITDTRIGAPKYKSTYVQDKIEQAKNKLKSSVTGHAAPIEELFYATEDIDKMNSEEFENARDIIDNQIKNKIAIPKSQADSGVSSGLYEYVRDYFRDDGTKVKGYYRRR